MMDNRELEKVISITSAKVLKSCDRSLIPGHGYCYKLIPRPGYQATRWYKNRTSL